jgi:hypothetical protein
MLASAITIACTAMIGFCAVPAKATVFVSELEIAVRSITITWAVVLRPMNPRAKFARLVAFVMSAVL